MKLAAFLFRTICFFSFLFENHLCIMHTRSVILFVMDNRHQLFIMWKSCVRVRNELNHGKKIILSIERGGLYIQNFEMANAKNAPKYSHRKLRGSLSLRAQFNNSINWVHKQCTQKKILSNFLSNRYRLSIYLPLWSNAHFADYSIGDKRKTPHKKNDKTDLMTLLKKRKPNKFNTV